MLECSVPRMIVMIFGQGSVPSIEHSSHNYKYHTQKKYLTSIFLYNSTAHSGHEIEQVRSSTYPFF